MPFNIWLPLPSVADSVSCLSNADLGIQRYQVLELVEHLLGIDKDASALPVDFERTELHDHPVVDMWRGHVVQLCEIGMVSSEEWSQRNKVADPVFGKIQEWQQLAVTESASFELPCWFGDIDVHLGHQGELLRMDLNHYANHFHPQMISHHLSYPKSAFA